MVQNFEVADGGRAIVHLSLVEYDIDYESIDEKIEELSALDLPSKLRYFNSLLVSIIGFISSIEADDRGDYYGELSEQIRELLECAKNKENKSLIHDIVNSYFSSFLDKCEGLTRIFHYAFYNFSMKPYHSRFLG